LDAFRQLTIIGDRFIDQVRTFTVLGDKNSVTAGS
jgi:hypothetical protein